MLKNLIEPLKIQFLKLKTPTKVCKLCFKEIKQISLNSLAKPGFSLCDECYLKLKPLFKKFEIGPVEGVSIYEYNEDTKSIIYQFKGCFDYELKSVFLDRYKDEIRFKYQDFVIVPVPSSKEHDSLRGFNHVEEVFKELKLPMIKCISKTETMKQSDRNAEERKEISKFLVMDESINISSKQILLVDDIFTTGSTLKACIRLLESKHPKCIKVLVLCKTPDLEK